MTHICPYCGGKMKRPPVDYDLTIKQGIVYNLILAAGPDGVSVEALSAGIFRGKAPVSIRSTIFRINQVIKPQRIRARHKTYFIQA